ncbi:cell division site-positioning protein MapZ family protein [Streptococcus hyovaginalis]|uniref:cell division site-positioning protein MapZ family protein n=1 Tax=Streptococcus hyovaginalis TaxID=149015 RepID=UPI00040266D8|nr:cell division site-positioning protein MapZ family protein [Streptococcus hyovaginalis]
MDKEKDNLDFDKAKDLTVGEAVRKDAEIKAGVTDEDSVLDKYIKQHPNEVASQKFETKDIRQEELDTATLDNFIQKQRQEVEAANQANQAEVDHTQADMVGLRATEANQVPESSLASTDFVSPAPSSETVHPTATTSADSVLRDSDEFYKIPFYKKRGANLLAILLALLAILGIGLGLNRFNGNETATSTSSSASSSSKQLDSSAKETSAQTIKDNEAFNDLYDGFFTSDKDPLLKNSEFSKLPELEKFLQNLEGTKFYNAAKEKYDNLKEQIDGIEAVNAQFDKPIIVDGKLDETAKPKADANFDNLSVATLNTGNATLDNLLQSAVKKGRDALDGVKSSSSSEAEASRQSSIAASESAAEAAAAASQTESQDAAPAQNNQESAQATAPAVPVVPSYGISGYDTSGLQRNLSRVPYNDAAIADSGNAAWTFAPGVLETVVGKAQARGNISGNNYILERVNIINGNGYYNMFKPDGTYLFSINAKTGYFVGNKPGNADGLDY